MINTTERFCSITLQWPSARICKWVAKQIKENLYSQAGNSLHMEHINYSSITYICIYLLGISAFFPTDFVACFLRGIALCFWYKGEAVSDSRKTYCFNFLISLNRLLKFDDGFTAENTFHLDVLKRKTLSFLPSFPPSLSISINQPSTQIYKFTHLSAHADFIYHILKLVQRTVELSLTSFSRIWFFSNRWIRDNSPQQLSELGILLCPPTSWGALKHW